MAKYAELSIHMNVHLVWFSVKLNDLPSRFGVISHPLTVANDYCVTVTEYTHSHPAYYFKCIKYITHNVK